MRHECRGGSTPRGQGQQMADADYDFGGGFSRKLGEQPLHVRDAMTAEKVQRYINIAGAISSLALVLGLGFWGYKLAIRDVNGVPVIHAMDGPMRTAPDDPGGEIADHQGLAVNNVAEVGIAAPTPERLILAPRPVELTEEDTAGLSGPQMPDVKEASAPADLLTGNAELALAATPLGESADPTEVAVDAALAEALGEVPENAGAEPEAEIVPELIAAPEGAITTSIRPRARPAGRAAAAPEEALALPPAVEVDPATIAAGTRLVQFGTFDTAEEARAEWTRLQGRFGELMVEKTLVVQPAERGGLTFYRLRAHGFEGEDDARRFCSAFVAQSAICIPVAHQ
jgi:SPOR domain